MAATDMKAPAQTNEVDGELPESRDDMQHHPPMGTNEVNDPGFDITDSLCAAAFLVYCGTDSTSTTPSASKASFLQNATQTLCPSDYASSPFCRVRWSAALPLRPSLPTAARSWLRVICVYWSTLNLVMDRSISTEASVDPTNFGYSSRDPEPHQTHFAVCFTVTDLVWRTRICCGSACKEGRRRC